MHSGAPLLTIFPVKQTRGWKFYFSSIKYTWIKIPAKFRFGGLTISRVTEFHAEQPPWIIGRRRFESAKNEESNFPVYPRFRINLPACTGLLLLRFFFCPFLLVTEIPVGHNPVIVWARYKRSGGLCAFSAPSNPGSAVSLCCPCCSRSKKITADTSFPVSRRMRLVARKRGQAALLRPFLGWDVRGGGTRGLDGEQKLARSFSNTWGKLCMKDVIVLLK